MDADRKPSPGSEENPTRHTKELTSIVRFPSTLARVATFCSWLRNHFFQSPLRAVSGVNYGQIFFLLMDTAPTKALSLWVPIEATAFVELEIGDFYGQLF